MFKKRNLWGSDSMLEIHFNASKVLYIWSCIYTPYFSWTSPITSMSEKGLQVKDGIWYFGSCISNQLVIWRVDNFIGHRIGEGDLSVKLF
jgi:hypothetical protein